MAELYPKAPTDPAEITAIGVEALRSLEPGWESTGAGDGMTSVLESNGRQVAELMDVVNGRWPEFVRYFAESVDRFPSIAAAPAIVSATFVMRDDAGYRIDAGLEVLVKTSGDDGITFAVVETVEVARGDRATRAGEVTLRAAPGYEGTAGNGLDSGNEAVVIRSAEHIESVELVGVSSGGVDAETETEFLERYIDEREIASPAPIIARDLAILARRVPGVARALAINLYQLLPEVIEVTYSGSGTGTLTDTATGRSVSLTSGLTAASLVTAFRALSPSTGNRYVPSATGGPLGTAPIVLSLSGRETYGPWQIATSGPTVSVKRTQVGSDSTRVERAAGLAVVGPDGLPLNDTVKGQVEALLEDMLLVNWVVTVIDATYTGIDVAFEAVTYPNEDAEAVRSAAVAAIQAYLSPATWGTRAIGEQPDWLDVPIVRYLEVAQILNEVPGLHYVTRLQIGVEGRSLGTADVTLTGPAALPRPGAGITGTVTEGT